VHGTSDTVFAVLSGLHAAGLVAAGSLRCRLAERVPPHRLALADPVMQAVGGVPSGTIQLGVSAVVAG
jgi:hypothetical protein